ncbi:MAG: hypothetical protein LBI92_10385 [Azoarcus sp.]|nr:hypothetical protein [Azoarcus sp.]
MARLLWMVALAVFLWGSDVQARPRAAAAKPAITAAMKAGKSAPAAQALLQQTGGDIPEALKPWKAWVLRGREDWLCPEVAGAHRPDFCAWPGDLKLSMSNAGVRFDQVWEIQRRSAAGLPGSREHWPEQVTVDGEVHPVLERGGMPIVWLLPGRHTVGGFIPWQERPRTLAVPASVALVSLTIDGLALPAPARRGNVLDIGSAASEPGPERAEDSVDYQIYRKLSDGIPARLSTRVRFKVSGKARELSVPDMLPAHFVPVRLVSPWAARLDQDGRLRVQAVPGQATVEIEARLDEPLQSVVPKLGQGRMQEVWSYEAAPSLRATAVIPGKAGGVSAVDPRQAGVPDDWALLPAFAVGVEAKFDIEQHSRGQGELDNQRLTLQREMWLDFSGDGFFARDRIEGDMRQEWRFDVAKPYTLERADSRALRGGAEIAPTPGGGDTSALLVTHGANERLSGVEWRQKEVTLNAGVRLAAGPFSRVPVTGWHQSFDSVEATLHLPYGYWLLAVPGADAVSSNVWMERWTVFDLFFVALFALLAWRLLGAMGGIVASVYLILAATEPFAPVLSFAAVVTLALLHRALPNGRVRRPLRYGQWLALVCFLATTAAFASMQLGYVLYPQLEGSDGGALVRRDAARGLDVAAHNVVASEVAEQFSDAESAPEPAPAPSVIAPNMEADSVLAPLRKKALKPQSRLGLSAAYPLQRYAQSTVTQTGGGEPAWDLGRQYRLHWSGPVTETRNVYFLISPPWLTRLVRLAMLALLGILAVRLFRTVFPLGSQPDSPPRGAEHQSLAVTPPAAPLALAVGVGLALFAVALSPSPVAAANSDAAYPPPALLEEFKARLLEAPACAPHCIDVSEARIDAGSQALRVTLAVHVEAPASLALPEPDERSALRNVRVDGAVRPVLRVGGNSYVALSRGVHRIRIEYALGSDTAALGFPLPPARVGFVGQGWRVEGIDEGRLLSETLNFSRIATGTEGDDGASVRAAQEFPPYVQVRRDFDFGLDWSIETRVVRVAPAEGGFTFPVPLLPGEHVTTPGVKVQDGQALAVFSGNAGAAFWTSLLDKKRTIELIAPPLPERAETWRVSVSPAWHLEWDKGVPVTLPPETGGNGVVFEFHPLPGERLVLKLSQPVKTEGSTQAIDRVRLESRIGRHASDHVLTFALRASQGGEQRLVLPQGIELIEARRSGAVLNVQVRGGALSLPVAPGMQSYTLVLRQHGEAGWMAATPAIDLGMPAANVDLRVRLDEQRWVLDTRGPLVGPSVLYWCELAAALLIAFLLMRSGRTALSGRQWLLLVLGFSTFSWAALLLVVLWLFVLEWRVRSTACAAWPAVKFNAMQGGIAALTVVLAAVLISAISSGLLGVPEMDIRGYGSSAIQLNWFVDSSPGILPSGEVFSLPIWIYRLLMPAWTLWLVYSLMLWLKRGAAAWIGNGYWKKTAPE